MSATNGDFFTYFALALDEALTERRSQIVGLRYGLDSGTPRTLQAVGQEMHLSRERIRQLLNRSLRIIRGKGRSQIRKGMVDAACAKLLLYLQETILPGESGDVERLFGFIQNDLSYLPLTTHIVPLITHFIHYENSSITSGPQVDLKDNLQERVRAYTLMLRQEAQQQHQQSKFFAFIDQYLRQLLGWACVGA